MFYSIKEMIIFCQTQSALNWCRVTHTYATNLIIIGSYNDLSSGRRRPIIWTNAEILLIGPVKS